MVAILVSLKPDAVIIDVINALQEHGFRNTMLLFTTRILGGTVDEHLVPALASITGIQGVELDRLIL